MKTSTMWGMPTSRRMKPYRSPAAECLTFSADMGGYTEYGGCSLPLGSLEHINFSSEDLL